jgi:preprotein translocase subunit SecE
VGPPAGAGERNYFASVLEELRKVVWPTWNELARMTGVVVTTVILMAVIVSAADFVLGRVVQQLYNTPSASAAGSQIKPSTVSPGPTVAPTTSATTPATSAPGTSAPVTP